MADLSDYLEATAGTMGGNGDIDLEDHRARLLQRLEKDALLCLVDCRASMFALGCTTHVKSDDTHSSPTGSASTGTHRTGTLLGSAATNQSLSAQAVVKREKSSTPSRSAPRTVDEEGHSNADQHAADNTAVLHTAFETAMRCILTLFQEKIISSDKDLLALVLYNTAEKRNQYDFSGVYVLHPFNLLGADSVQEVEQLVATGVPDSAAYKRFVQQVGHRPTTAASTLSDALWAAQHMFLNIRTAAVKYRRIFVFTDDDEPTRGSAVEYRRCCARARDLYEAGVALEVFGMGSAGVKEEVHGNGSSSSATATATTPALGGSLLASFNPATLLSATLDTTSPAALAATMGTAPLHPTPTTTTGHTGFSKHRFWELLLRDATAAADSTLMSTATLDSDASLAVPQHYAGAVYVNQLTELLDVVRRKVHPQRPFLNTTMQIGMRSDGGAVPRMAVSVYVPLMRTNPPKTEWLEGSTNALIKRRTRLVKRSGGDGGAEDAGEDDNDENHDDGGAPLSTTGDSALIRPEDTCYATMVGGHHVYFTEAERAKVTEVAAAGTEAGLFIICFKNYGDIIQHKHVVERSCFLHANLRQGGPDSVRLFTQLVRTLRKKGRVAVALYRMRPTSKPKLVALIPSPDLSQRSTAAAHSARTVAPCVQFPVESLAAEGLGFYLLPLPYADDIRPVPRVETTTSVNRGGGQVKLEEDAVKPAHVELAREVVRRLSVNYDITAVPNPVLQLVYQNLQDMALRDLANSAQPGAPGRFAVPDDEDRSADTVLTRCRVEDYTLPDHEGMKRYTALFHDFNTQVLGPQYDADKYCPLPGQRAPAASGQRRTRAAAEDAEEDGGAPTVVKKEPTVAATVKVKKEDEDASGADDIIAVVGVAANRNAWTTLTVAQLKDYIRAKNGGSVSNKKKDELITMAKYLVTK